MGIDWRMGCIKHQEEFWAGSLKPMTWQGFQVGNRHVYLWFARHACTDCKILLWTDSLVDNETIENCQRIHYVPSEQIWLPLNWELDNCIIHPLSVVNSDIQPPIDKATGKRIIALEFSTQVALATLFEEGHYLEPKDFKNPLIINFVDLENHAITKYWAEWLEVLVKHTIKVKAILE